MPLSRIRPATSERQARAILSAGRRPLVTGPRIRPGWWMAGGAASLGLWLLIIRAIL